MNEDLINSISALINRRLTNFNSDMITIMYKSGGQCVPSGDMDSYCVDFEIYQKDKKENQEIPTLMTWLHYL